jgi:energy-coupling factor transporter transmembrane protein EcfT
MFAGIFGIAFVHAFDRAERIAKAMEARGYIGKFPVTEPLKKPTAGGYALIALGIASLALAAYSRYFDQELFGW